MRPAPGVRAAAGPGHGDTTQQPGGASGGSSSTGGGAGGLAETGSGDHGALKALGLVAGTAILLGGAVFAFMPARRTR